MAGVAAGSNGAAKRAMRGAVNSPGFLSRLVFALGCFVRLVVDARFAAAVRRLLEGGALDDTGAHEAAALPASKTPVAKADEAPEPLKLAPVVVAAAPAADAKASARVLLALLQREGRFIDFLEQPVDGFSDADVGAAARVVHAGCKKALAGRVTVAPVLAAEEGARVSLGGQETDVVVAGAGGLRAGSFTVVHRGWRLTHDDLPSLTAGHDGALLQAAEVE